MRHVLFAPVYCALRWAKLLVEDLPGTHMPAVLAVAMLLMPQTTSTQGLSAEQQYSVPEWVHEAMARSGLDKKLAFDNRLNPFCLRGDFDGDGRADFAVLVRERTSSKAGIAFVHRATGRVFVVGAGTSIGYGSDDFTWMDAWIVFDKGAIPQGATKERPPTLRGDALLIFKTEAASAILWWTGTRYRWYQQGN